MSSLRPTRWTNQSLPQLLQISTFLLYFTAVSAVLSRVIRFGNPTAYYLLGLRIFGLHVTASGNVSSGGSDLIELVAILGLGYAAAMIASERKLGYQLGVALAAGLVVIPVLVLGTNVLSSDYLITWAFDIALLALLVHPQSRDYQKIWFK